MGGAHLGQEEPEDVGPDRVHGGDEVLQLLSLQQMWTAPQLRACVC